MQYSALVIVLILCIIVICQYDNIETLVSRQEKCNDIDGRCYSIVGKYDVETFDEASETLAYLNSFAVKLMRHLRSKYLWHYMGTQYHINIVSFLLRNYNPDSIIENAPVSNVNTSYVEDKGKVFAICLREKKSGRNLFHDKHTLEFVMMHEMAHLANKGVGHNKADFWPIFKFLLDEANNIHLHTPVDYSKYPIVYCSLYVNYNPYFDYELPRLAIV